MIDMSVYMCHTLPITTKMWHYFCHKNSYMLIKYSYVSWYAGFHKVLYSSFVQPMNKNSQIMNGYLCNHTLSFRLSVF